MTLKHHSPVFLCRFLLVVFLALGLGGCALLSPGPPPSRYQLSPDLPRATLGQPLQRQLIVALPVAGPDLDSDRIALVFDGREVRVLADARWAAPAPQLLQRNLIAAFESSGTLAGVGDETSGIVSDARLVSDIRQFGLVYATEASTPEAVFEASFRLLNVTTGKVAAIHTVSKRVPAGGKDALALVRAVETALGQGLDETVRWTVDHMRLMP